MPDYRYAATRRHMRSGRFIRRTHLSTDGGETTACGMPIEEDGRWWLVALDVPGCDDHSALPGHSVDCEKCLAKDAITAAASRAGVSSRPRVYKPSPAAIAMLEKMEMGMSPFYGLFGRSEHGGACGTLCALRRHGLIDDDGLTADGLEALAAARTCGGQRT